MSFIKIVFFYFSLSLFLLSLRIGWRFAHVGERQRDKKTGHDSYADARLRGSYITRARLWCCAFADNRATHRERVADCGATRCAMPRCCCSTHGKRIETLTRYAETSFSLPPARGDSRLVTWLRINSARIQYCVNSLLRCLIRLTFWTYGLR